MEMQQKIHKKWDACPPERGKQTESQTGKLNSRLIQKELFVAKLNTRRHESHGQTKQEQDEVTEKKTGRPVVLNTALMRPVQWKQPKTGLKTVE